MTGAIVIGTIGYEAIQPIRVNLLIASAESKLMTLKLLHLARSPSSREAPARR